MPAAQTTLRGMTWDHTRGYAPMQATAAAYAQAHPGVQIIWEKRSLQAFADFPIEQLATEYDLIVIDHPHVGVAARSGCLLPLDGQGKEAELATLARQSLGPSHATYQFNSRQWALAIDAATQVACYRPDLLQQIPRQWNEVLELARQGRVIWPIKPVDALMSFFTLAANRGTPCNSGGGGELIERDAGVVVLDALRSLADLVPRDCLSMNPIQAYERMVQDDQFIYCPLGYGYTNYARSGYRPQLLRFTDIPALGNNGPIGSCIGGTGIAVSATSAARDVAIDYAYWIASADVQRRLYFDSGGQPANAVAWEDDHTNAVAHNFFRDTRATLNATYVRPRYDGYLTFQDQAGDAVNAFLAGQGSAQSTWQKLQQLHRESQEKA